MRTDRRARRSTGKSVHTPLLRARLVDLREYRHRRDEEARLLGDDWRDEEDFIFVKTHGESLGASQFGIHRTLV